MLTPEEQALATDLAKWLIELYVERQEARETNDTALVDELQREIDRLEAERQQILIWDSAGSA